MPSTARVSAVCVPVATVTAGSARADLAAASVMVWICAVGWPLAAAGGGAEEVALDAWLQMTGRPPVAMNFGGKPVLDRQGGNMCLCYYTLQHPFSAATALAGWASLHADDVKRIEVTAPHATVLPLIQDCPETDLQGKSSPEDAIAAALLDGFPGFADFTCTAIRWYMARRLADPVCIELEPGGEGVLRTLGSEGFVRDSANKGYFITSLNRSDQHQTYMMRQLFENAILRHSCERMSNVELDALRRANDAFYQAVDENVP